MQATNRPFENLSNLLAVMGPLDASQIPLAYMSRFGTPLPKEENFLERADAAGVCVLERTHTGVYVYPNVKRNPSAAVAASVTITYLLIILLVRSYTTC